MRDTSCPGSIEEDWMSNMQDQIWHGATFTITGTVEEASSLQPPRAQ
ncbi:MAG: hypothetical protein WCA10_21185 [Terracidiphilus sp.]